MSTAQRHAALAPNYPEHDRDSCSDAAPTNSTPEGSTGCARCTALVIDNLRAECNELRGQIVNFRETEDGLMDDYKRMRGDRDEALEAVAALLTAQSSRRHPLGAPDEGIATLCAEAAAKGRAVLAKHGVKS